MHIILLAAGLSTRMHDRFKLLLPWKDTTLIAWCAEQAINTDYPVTVVTGHYAQEVTQALSHLSSLQFIYNEQYELGQFSSIQKGINAIGKKDVFIVPGDLPLLSSSHYVKLAPYLTDYDAVRPYCLNTPGHPVAISSQLRTKILEAPTHTSMHALLQSCNVYQYQDADIAWISDIDTPEQYLTLTASR